MSNQEQGLGIAEFIGDKREAILALAEQHGAYNVRVFGSVARGEATSESDIDFLVTWDIERMSAWGGIGLTLDLQALLGCSVDVVSDEALHWYIRERVLSEAIPLDLAGEKTYER